MQLWKILHRATGNAVQRNNCCLKMELEQRSRHCSTCIWTNPRHSGRRTVSGTEPGLHCGQKRIDTQVEALALEEKEEQKAPGGRTKLETYLQEITEASALTRELAALFIQDVQIGERDGKTGAQEIKIDWLI